MEAVEEVIYGCVKGLDERISDCNLAMNNNCFNVEAGMMMVAIDLTDSKAVAITTLDICVFIHMLPGGSYKSIPNIKRLLTIQMDVSFV